MFKFEIIHQSRISRARVGRIHTPHGIIDTPHFVPVGTNAAVKTLDSKIVEQAGVQLMFCNTYHLLLHPGTQTVAAAGGLHKFMNRTQPIITDSGGFQVFSLAYGTVHDELKGRAKKKSNGSQCEDSPGSPRREGSQGGSSIIKITEDGVLFRSYRDGSPIMLTPESSVQAQHMLGADIIIPLDELPPYHIDRQKLRASFDRTHRWEKRSLDEHLKNKSSNFSRQPAQEIGDPGFSSERADQAMYAVIHGGLDQDLRAESVAILSREAFDGFAIGGSFGKNHGDMIAMLTHLMPLMPQDKPNHLLGMGDPNSIPHIVSLGIDTFDSSYPTRCARHGLLFTRAGSINLTRSEHKQSFVPIDPTCTCHTCTHYTRAYLHHLFKAREMTGLMLATIHNIHALAQLMSEYRQKILDDTV